MGTYLFLCSDREETIARVCGYPVGTRARYKAHEARYSEAMLGVNQHDGYEAYLAWKAGMDADLRAYDALGECCFGRVGAAAPLLLPYGKRDRWDRSKIYLTGESTKNLDVCTSAIRALVRSKAFDPDVADRAIDALRSGEASGLAWC